MARCEVRSAAARNGSVQAANRDVMVAAKAHAKALPHRRSPLVELTEHRRSSSRDKCDDDVEYRSSAPTLAACDQARFLSMPHCAAVGEGC